MYNTQIHLNYAGYIDIVCDKSGKSVAQKDTDRDSQLINSNPLALPFSSIDIYPYGHKHVYEYLRYLIIY